MIYLTLTLDPYNPYGFQIFEADIGKGGYGPMENYIDYFDLHKWEIVSFAPWGRLVAIGGKVFRYATATKAVGTTKRGELLIEVGGKFSPSEIRAAEHFSNLGNDVILRMPVNISGVKTSDLLVNGVKYDVYTPKTPNVNGIIIEFAQMSIESIMEAQETK